MLDFEDRKGEIASENNVDLIANNFSDFLDYLTEVKSSKECGGRPALPGKNMGH